jgi:NADH-quinone oxidoreductase subunit K
VATKLIDAGSGRKRMNAVGDYHLLNSSLLIAVVLFVLGIAGFVARRNVIVMFLSAGVMLQGVTLALCAFSSFHGNWSGRIAALFLLMTTVVVGTVVLAIVVVFAQQKRSLDVARWQRFGRSQQPHEQFQLGKKPGFSEKTGFLNADSR